MTGHLRVVAIDGPAASGKSSTAAAVADALGLVHIDSGSLYRTLTWLAITNGFAQAEEITAAAERAGVTLERDGRSLAVRVAGRSVEEEIRADPVTARVSEVAALPRVRDWVNRLLRAALLREGGGVMDGRDIGTVVFPDACLKVFLTATPQARAERRLRQRMRGEAPAAGAVAAEAEELAARDRYDAGRAVAPLRQDAEALLLDTTGLTLREQVETIVEWAERRGLRRA